MSNLRKFAEREVTGTANGGERRTTCASCGQQIAAGARYCVHCGAEQAVPTPIAAVAAAMARGRPREAANAAHAEPARAVVPGASAPEATSTSATFGRTPAAEAASAAPMSGRTAPPPANSVQPPRPAYDVARRSRTLAGVLVGCLVAVAIAVASVAVWRAERGAAGDSNAGAVATNASPAAVTPQATETSPAPEVQTTTPGASSSLASAPRETSALPGAGETPTEPPATTSAASGATGAPVEIKVLPPHAPASRTAHRGAPEKAASTSPPPPPPVAESRPERAPAPVAQARSVAPAATTHVADRWQRLDEELSRCTRSDFITRVICGQRARFRYCDGYWGKVAQCPGNPVAERGQ